jgi:hypothetical protein
MRLFIEADRLAYMVRVVSGDFNYSSSIWNARAQKEKLDKLIIDPGERCLTLRPAACSAAATMSPRMTSA